MTDKDDEQRYDAQGNFIPRKLSWDEKYTDYYGPVVEDKDGDKAGKFFIKEYQEFGRLHFIGELVVIILFGVFIAYGIYNLYYIGVELKQMYIDYATQNAEVVGEVASSAKEYASAYAGYVALAIFLVILVFVFSLVISFFIVRLFSVVVSFLMYGSVIVQIALAAYLYIKVDWEYNWIFLIFIAINILLITVGRKSFQKSVTAIKMGSKAVARQGWQLLIPQITQTIFIALLCFFFTMSSIAYALQLSPVAVRGVLIGSRAISRGWVYFGYCCLFVFCAFVVYYVSQGMKIAMIHHWYRGGGRMGFGRSYHIIRYRWWGLLGYALLSTVIHMIQFARKMIMGEFGPKNLKEAFSMTGDLLPGKEHSFSKKAGTPWYERLWMGLNTFTLPAIVIEDKLFHGALLRSVYLMIRDIAQMFIKETHIKYVLFILQYSLIIVNTMLGAIIGYAIGVYMAMPNSVLYILTGYAIGVYMAMPNSVLYILTGVGAGIFIYVGGITTTLILDDVNLAYVTVLYILSIDEVYAKTGYTIDKLEHIDGQPSVVIDDKKTKHLTEMHADDNKK